MDIVYQKNAQTFVFLRAGHIKNVKHFQISGKSIFMHMHTWISNTLNSQMNFDFLRLTKSWKFKKTGRFWIKKGPFVKNFAKQPNIFSFLKFLELFFTPKNIPHKIKNSKPDVITIFLGHPVK